MRALAQRVKWAQVEVAGQVVGRIERGLLVYAAVGPADGLAEAARMAEKLTYLRIFDDAQGKLNISVQDDRGGVLVISNFTLLADTRKGRRPAFNLAAPGEAARPVHEALLAELARLGCTVATGVFGADMQITSQADGPVNVIIDVPPQTGE
jgi:D-tyrosyl-tRNA(Tyr) deacylase